MTPPTRYKCLLCGRDKFTHKTPHKCIGGFRKRGIKWEEIYEEKVMTTLTELKKHDFSLLSFATTDKGFSVYIKEADGKNFRNRLILDASMLLEDSLIQVKETDKHCVKFDERTKSFRIYKKS